MAPLPPRKKGARHGPHQAGQGDQDHGRGRPRWSSSRRARIAARLERASPAEVTLVDATLAQRFVRALPVRLIGDKAYDSAPLNAQLAARGITLIALHRAKRRRPRTQDGRALRRYRRRWKIERLNAWLQNYRRIVVRYEYHLDNYLGFVKLGCLLICSGHL